MTEPCDHEWVDDGQLPGHGAVQQCIKCPCWRTKWETRRHTRDPEDTRRAVEETSRYLGEHRDV